ncbi:uncharacterized protein F4822DRAFT_384784 [Hypoxylon trugodes]|uniref:uncharacterized protein n=1 Tax=Hypoxylon trugodes TaxID=326681 RepID=UPI00219E0A8E|nr:uncharacterized protein F4822DRAFT_384784 [Hypoxylon trugodes]KAI1393473.1 hypothetical protein F4822DRAFT_384784 [Hypoxylon trugodes]
MPVQVDEQDSGLATSQLHDEDRSLKQELWTEAYDILKSDPENSRLLVNFKKYLKEDVDAEPDMNGESFNADEIEDDVEQLKLIQKFAKKRLEKLPEAQLTFTIGGKPIVVRQVVRKAIKLVLTFKDVVSSAISAEPQAALAWAGIITILPILDDAFQQDEDAANGLNQILFLLVRYQEVQDGFLSFELQDSYQSESSCELRSSIRSQIVRVYAQAYVYLMRFLLQYKRRKVHRFARNVVAADNWKEMWKAIEDASQLIDQGVRDRVTTRILQTWDAVDNIRTRAINLEDLQQATLKALQANNADQLLLSLPFAGNAVFDSAAVVNSDSPCWERTQRRILNNIQNWAEDPTGEAIFWLYGMAGTGKTSVALTIANALYNREPLADKNQPSHNAFFGASFFFKQGDITRNSTKEFFPTISRCLAEAFLDFKSQVVSCIQENLAIGTKAPQQQFDHLIIRPLSVLDRQTILPIRLIVIIDALDECVEPTETRQLLNMMTALNNLDQIQLRFLVTSRNDDHIARDFSNMPHGIYRAASLDKIELALGKDRETDDITYYLTHRLAQIAEYYKVPQHGIDIERLSKKADGLFIYAATACRFLDDDDFTREESRKECLDLIFEDDEESAPQQKIDEIYLKVLSLPGMARRPRRIKDKLYSHVGKILGFIVVLFAPISVPSLTKLLGLSENDVDDVLDRLHSVVHVPRDKNIPLGLVHLSFRDFLLNEERSKQLPFRIQELPTHQEVFTRCLELMSRDLRQDMCNLLSPGTPASQVSSSQVDENFPHYLQYTCRYWVHHLAKLDENQREEVGLKDNGQVHEFLRKSFLYWLEAMSLIQDTANAVLIVNHLQTLINSAKNPGLSTIIHDAKRFVLMNQSVISYAPLQIYCSALLFSPAESIIRRTFEDMIPSWVRLKPKPVDNWPSELSILEGHTSPIVQVAFSPTDDLIMSQSLDGTIRIWNYVTGIECFKFDAPWPSSCAFSSDGKMVALGMHNGCIKVFEFATGRTIDLMGNPEFVFWVGFSPANTNTIASMTLDKTIRVWDIDRKQAIRIIKTPFNWPGGIAFSPDGQSLLGYIIRDSVNLDEYPFNVQRQTSQGDAIRYGTASSSSDRDWVGMLSIERGELVNVFNTDREVNTITITRDGIAILCTSNHYRLILWNLSGEVLRRESYDRQISIALIPQDERLVAIAENGGIVELRRLDTWDLVRSISNGPWHTDFEFQISISRDGRILAAGCDDNAIRLWDLTSDIKRVHDKKREDWVYSIKTVPGNDNLILTRSGEGLGLGIRFWNADGEPVNPPANLQHIFQHMLRLPTFSEDGRLAALDVGDERTPDFQLWDGDFKGDRARYHCDNVIFSPGDVYVAAFRQDVTHILECTTLEKLLEIPVISLKKYPKYSPSMIFRFSPNGQFACASLNRRIHLWDLAVRKELASHECAIGLDKTAFSSDSKLLAFRPHVGLSYIVVVETATGKEICAPEVGSDCNFLFDGEGHVITAAQSDARVSVCRIASGNKETLFTINVSGKHVAIGDIAISKTGRLVMTASLGHQFESTAILLGDISTGKAIGMYTVEHMMLRLLTPTADSHHVLSSLGRIPTLLGPPHQDVSLEDMSEVTQNCLYAERQWVTQGFEKLLWLPSGYRTMFTEATKNTVILGRKDGSIIILKFDIQETSRLICAALAKGIRKWESEVVSNN